jgi:membrane protein CcdC involved in cytochrome C biogenesis
MGSNCQLTREKLIVAFISFSMVELKILWDLEEFSVGLCHSVFLLWIYQEVRRAQLFMQYKHSKMKLFHLNIIAKET